jgi:hypothetical protein
MYVELPSGGPQVWVANYTPHCLKAEGQPVKKKKNVRSPWNMLSDIPEAPG